ncbi:MAG: nucleotide exchange factor GrpE [Deltaproteobacteria bacterium]|nr:MAG: nucleotide exchange factor GrpE [Deltaproteobacteria bacterium]
MKKVTSGANQDPMQTAEERGVSDSPPLPGPAHYWGEHPLLRIAADQEALIKECASLEAELEECHKRAHKEKKALLLEMLEVMDGFDRLFRNLEERAADLEPQTKRLAGNFRTVRRLLSLALERAGVTLMELETLDLRFHEVVETRPAPGVPDGTILEAVQPGYIWNGQILRYAKVVVSKNTEEVQHG